MDHIAVSKSEVVTYRTWKPYDKDVWWFCAFGIVSVICSAIGVNIIPAASAQSDVTLTPVTFSNPVQRNLERQLGFLGQFSAVENVELRAQVGGTLNEIHFTDGDIVDKGGLLFVIDAEPYEIKLSQAKAQLTAAKARFNLAEQQLARAETLKATDAGSTQNVEQRRADKLLAVAAVNGAEALVRDAQFDLEHTRVTAPFTGRIGKRLISIGNLVSGSRAGMGPTTLLATLVSLDPIHLDFDMSETDYARFMKDRGDKRIQGSDKVRVTLGTGESDGFDGVLDFIDNAFDRSSGTIQARAILGNSELRLTPGAFGRVHLSISKPTPTLMVPDLAVLPELSDHIVLTLGDDDVVQSKRVVIGELRGSLRVIRSGLEPTDRVVIDGIPNVRPGSKVAPQPGQITYQNESNEP